MIVVVAIVASLLIILGRWWRDIDYLPVRDKRIVISARIALLALLGLCGALNLFNRPI